MKRVIVISTIFLILLLNLSSSGEDLIAVKIIKYDSHYSFIVIDKGVINGMESGMEFVVVKDGAEIGKIQVVKVKENVSACDVKEMMSEAYLKSGDIITIYPYGATMSPQEVLETEDEREKPLEDQPITKDSYRESLFDVPSEVQGRSIQEVMWVKNLEGEVITADILADSDLTFYVLRDVLEDHKVIVTHSNRLQGTLTGFKTIEMSLLKGLFADFIGSKERKIVYDVFVQKIGPKTSRVNIGLKYIAYSRSDISKVKVIKSGRYLSEVQKMLNKVRNKTAKIQAEWGE
ncbi:MAG: hypothetical protein P9L98_01380 [Candidatus Kaelpia imicola]|nr:hypothetical protein [Candidatus Kaelpia imicola]